MEELKEFIQRCKKFGDGEYEGLLVQSGIRVYVSVDGESIFIEAKKGDRTTTVLINPRSRSNRAVPTIDAAVRHIYMVLG